MALRASAQEKPGIDGQASFITSYGPDNDPRLLLGGRYIPEVSYGLKIDSSHVFDLEVSANISGSVAMRPFDSAHYQGSIRPYRAWGRFSGKRYEIRLGLQKIDFGSATLLRPMQWFNQIDPRDPLQLTNGMYAALGRYYFKNNANMWLWVLYGNEKTRGFDALATYKQAPEYGGRLQYPVPKGEIAASWHHRTADAGKLPATYPFVKVPEDRIGLDGKWDLGVGLWFELSYTRKWKDVGAFTHQSLFNIGADYTFGIGNGLNAVVEHLVSSFGSQPFALKGPAHITAATLAYPLGLFDNLSILSYYTWASGGVTFFMNYAHEFKKITAYVMAFYNPAIQQGIQRNELVNTLSGPGIRLMLVYDH